MRESKVVEEMEEKYPEMTSGFKDIMWEQYVVFCEKQKNYGPTNISMGSDLIKSEDRRLSHMGLFFRMNDKIQRIKQLVVLNVSDEVGETVQDTFQDLSVYGIIAQLISKGRWGK